MLIQKGVCAARASFAVAVTDGHATDDVFALRPMRRAVMRRDVSVRVLLIARVRRLHRRLHNARRRLRAGIQKKGDSLLLFALLVGVLKSHRPVIATRFQRISSAASALNINITC